MVIVSQEKMYELYHACLLMAQALQPGAQGQMWLKATPEELNAIEAKLLAALEPEE